MSRVWELKPDPPLNYGGTHVGNFPILAKLLYNRQVEDDRVENFLFPDYELLHDPFDFVQMQKAVDRIALAIERSEKIVIYSDYDADAVTASAVLIQAFRVLGVEAESYIPNRFTEGYGLNVGAFQDFLVKGVNLVITVDTGTNAVEVANWCVVNGLDLIITDHHEITDSIPEAYALINPKNPQDRYPDKQITGVGVAFKLASALFETFRTKGLTGLPEGWEKWLLDLVAIGTIADCHDLSKENRILVSYGLKVLAKTRWPGLKAMLNRIGVSKISSETVAYALAPRINAAGRLEHAGLALNALIANDIKTAKILTEQLESLNAKRKVLTERILSEAREMAYLKQDREVLVLSHESWHKGLVGIVAGRLSQEFCRPVVVLEKGEKEATGSVRSFGNFNTVEALKFSQEYLVRFGGHKEAAGLTLLSEHIDAFQARLLEYPQMDAQNSEIPLVLDAELEHKEINFETLQIIDRLEPYGAGNPMPKFLVKEARLEQFKIIGKTQSHLQAGFVLGGKRIEAVGFGLGYWSKRLELSRYYDLAVELMSETWQGKSKLKLRILDIRPFV